MLRWLKAVGDEVAVGDELVEIETDKANMVYEADAAGTLIEILAEEGETLPIGEVIARVGDAAEAPAGGDGGDAGKAHRTSRSAAEARSRRRRRGPATTPRPPPGRDGPAPARQPAPAHPRLAPTGGSRPRRSPGGSPRERGRRPRGPSRLRAGRADRQGGRRDGAAAGRRPPRRPRAAAPRPPADAGAAERPETAKGRSRSIELTKLQQTVARRMAESKATAPHFYLQAEIDMSRAVEARSAAQGAPRPRATSSPRSTTWSSRPARSRCASSRAPTAPTATAASSSTRGSTSASPSPPRTRWSSRPSSTPTARACAQIADRDAGAGRAGPRRLDHAAGALRRHLHRLQPRDVRDRQLRRGDQPAAGGDPRRRRDRRDAGRPRRRDRPPRS